MLNIFKNNKYLILLVIITISTICLTFRHNVGLIIDCGREAYYPQQILNGEILYKNLFCIYGPFAYLFNAFLYKIFGINLNVLCVSGSICALGIVVTLFLIAKKLFNEKIAFNFSSIAIAVGIAPTYVFNYSFPYSFSMTYGLLTFLLSLLFLINFVCSNKNIYLYLSLFLAGISICSKYEFVPYLLVYFILFWKMKPSLKIITNSLLSLSFVPMVSFLVLFLQGLNISDIKNSISIIITMSKTQTLKYFYMHCGVIPHKQSIIALFVTSLCLLIPFIIYVLPIFLKEKLAKNQVLTLILTYSSICLILVLKLFKMNDIFMALPIILAIAAVINYKKLMNNFVLFLVVLSSILFSLKIFWGLVLNSYGIYYLPLILIAIAFIFKDKFSEKDWDYISFYVLIFALLIGFNNIKTVSNNNICLSTSKGKIYVEKKYEKTRELLDFINKNTQKTDEIIIFPEGMMINFLSNRKTDGFYNSMIPLYEETFGVEMFRKHFSKKTPKYIIFNSWNSSDYYFSIICKDYGFDFCNFVQKNYFEKINLSGNFSYVIFEKK
ncbi:MAG: hypothetical protein ACI37S_03395 [Candidatus Gastranaerophilaceae bacterium]